MQGIRDEDTLEVGKISRALEEMKKKDYRPPFIVEETCLIEGFDGKNHNNEAIARICINNVVMHEAAKGVGPLHALDKAIRKCLSPHFACIRHIRITQLCAHDFSPKGLGGKVTVILHFKVREKKGFFREFSELAKSPTIVGATQTILLSVYEYYCSQSKQ